MAMYPKLNSRSPWFVQRVTEQVAFCKVYVWNGEATSAGSTPQYTLTKIPSQGAATFEVAELIRDYIEQDSNYSSGAVWCRVDIGDNVAPFTVTESHLMLANEGYEIHSNGLQTAYNLDSSLDVAINSDITTLYIPEGSTMQLPVYGNSRAGNTCTYQIYNTGVAGAIQSIGASEAATAQYNYIPVPSNTSKVVINLGGSDITYLVDNGACSKYDTKKITFINQKGAHQDLFFHMRSKETISVESTTFDRSLIDYRALSIGNDVHQTQKKVINAGVTFTLNTDFVEEAYSDVFTELMLSEYVFLTQNGVTQPVNITDSSLERKTHVNDGLIQFEINVKSGSQYVNQIR